MITIFNATEYQYLKTQIAIAEAVIAEHELQTAKDMGHSSSEQDNLALWVSDTYSEAREEVLKFFEELLQDYRMSGTEELRRDQDYYKLRVKEFE